MRMQQGQALFWICLSGILNKETGGKKINKTPRLILIPHLNRRRDHGRGPTYEGKISGEQNLSISAWGRDPEPYGLSPGPRGLPREQGWKLPEIQSFGKCTDNTSKETGWVHFRINTCTVPNLQGRTACLPTE